MTSARRRPVAVALAFFVVAGALRLYHLDERSLWLDEVLTATSIQLHFHQVIDWLAGVGDQVPLIYLLAWGEGRLGFTDPFALRLPAAVVGSLFVPALYLLGRDLLGERPAIFAGIVATFISFAVWYSQEARMYAFVLLFGTAQAWAAYRCAVRPTWFAWAALAVVTVLASYTHYMTLVDTGVLFALLAGCAVLRAGGRRIGEMEPTGRVTPVAGLAAATAVVAVSFLPWLPYVWRFLFTGGNGHIASFASAQATLLASSARLLWGLGLSPVLALLVVAGAGWVAARLVPARPIAAAVLLLTLLAPVAALAWSLQLAFPNLWPRYLASAYPSILLLAAAGAEAVTAAALALARGRRPLAIGAAAGALLALVTAWPLPWLYGVHKDDWKTVSGIIDGPRPAAAVIGAGVESGWVEQNLSYYAAQDHSNVPLVDISDLDRTRALDIRRRSGTVWLAFVNGYDPSGLRAEGFMAVWPSYSDLSGRPRQGIVERRLVGVTLVRLADDGGSPDAQLRALLAWAAPIDGRAGVALQNDDL